MSDYLFMNSSLTFSVFPGTIGCVMLLLSSSSSSHSFTVVSSSKIMIKVNFRLPERKLGAFVLSSGDKDFHLGAGEWKIQSEVGSLLKMILVVVTVPGAWWELNTFLWQKEEESVERGRAGRSLWWGTGAEPDGNDEEFSSRWTA